MIHAKTPIVRLSPFFLLALLFPFFSFRFVSFCRSGQPPPLVPRTKFLSFSVDLCIFIFRRHPSFFFLLLSLSLLYTHSSQSLLFFPPTRRFPSFEQTSRRLFHFRAEDLSSSLSRTTPTIQIWPSCRSTTTTTTMYSCSNYPRGCRGRCNIQGGKCSDCTVCPSSKQLSLYI